MKHKHYEMIVAKAANMDLVVFSKNQATGGWLIQNDQETTEFGDCVEYFLCLPQHNESGQCLHWLNSGEVQLDHWDDPMPNSGVKSNCYLVDFDEDIKSLPWRNNHPFMDEAQEIRIKPRKEKRWIAIAKNFQDSNSPRVIDPHLFKLKEDAIEFHGSDGYQFIEIEVEV